MEIIRQKCDEAGSRLFLYNSEFSSEVASAGTETVSLNYKGSKEYRDILLALAGEHQVINAALAIKAIEIVSEKYPEMDCDIRKGLKSVTWPGRLEMIKEQPPVLIDGAHNPPAAEVLSAYLRKLLGAKYSRIIMVIGVMGDKDIEGILKPLLPLAAEIIFASPRMGGLLQQKGLRMLQHPWDTLQ